MSVMKQRAARWSVYAAIAIAFAIACAYLSNWQFSRNEERATMLALVAANYDAEPIDAATVLDQGFDPEDDEWHPVVMTGRYLTDQQLLVRNRAQGGTSAFEVLVPFELADGRIVVVDRGWVAPGEHEVPKNVPPAPEGETTVIGRMRPGEPLPKSGRSAPDGQLPTIHLPSVAEVAGETTETSFYLLMVSEDPAPATRPSELASPTDDPGPHLSYAIQWILFAIMGFVFIGYMIRTEIKARREDAEDADDDEELPAAKMRAGRAPRKDRDADEEDALLDA
ncbi:SURF1 family cytochrome oxidase biogenesis protein [Microbacterium stercoris]